MEALLGGVLGGVARLAPEVLKFFDRKNERAHELKMQDNQRELIKLQSHTRIDETAAASEGEQAASAMQAFREAIQAQGRPSGVKWIDGLSSLVRPLWTYLVLLTWATIKYVNVGVMLYQGGNWLEIQAVLWTADDAGMLSTLATFWFLDRVIRKAPQ